MKRVLYLQTNIFRQFFNYQWLAGDPQKSLSEPNTVVLTESLARKYFGDKEPMGQVINLDNRFDLKVTGLIKDLPGNTHLPFIFMVSFETIKNDLKQAMSNSMPSSMAVLHTLSLRQIILSQDFKMRCRLL